MGEHAGENDGSLVACLCDEFNGVLVGDGMTGVQLGSVAVLLDS